MADNCLTEDVNGGKIVPKRRTKPMERLHDDSIMPFGKHKGQRLGEVPDDYLIWFLGQDWCDQWPDLVEYANECIEDE